MGICKGCIHDKVCNDNKIYGESILSCDDFKNKDDFVEKDKYKISLPLLMALHIVCFAIGWIIGELVF